MTRATNHNITHISESRSEETFPLHKIDNFLKKGQKKPICCHCQNGRMSLLGELELLLYDLSRIVNFFVMKKKCLND